ncbi:MAG: hypothetical protein JXR97_02110, partial [Planctomycetes bacterium]|nr:hypothetical protein [Planctomycetota bacterium]
REFEGGLFACPVCGFLLPFPPYEMESAKGSNKFCDSCHTQFGWDDMIPPDSPKGYLKSKWEDLREVWLKEQSGSATAGEQLANIGIEL